MTGHVATAAVDIAAPPSRVWSVLTEPDEVARWMSGSQLSTSWEVGSPITWSGEYDGRSYEDKGEVRAYDEPTRLSVTHYSPMMGQPDEPENYHTLVYELSKRDDGTHLTLEQDGCDSEEQAEQFSANWQGMLDALKGAAES